MTSEQSSSTPASRSPSGSSPGDPLYEVVRAYDSFEHHRTGTAMERETQAWLGQELSDRGARVRTAEYEFPQFVVDEHVVTVDDVPVESLPLWYAGVGRHDTRDVHRFAWPFSGGNHASTDEWASIVEDDRPSVAATTGLGGLLGVPNRSPRFRLDQPVALVAGSAAEQVEVGDLRVISDTALRTGRSTNVFGAFGRHSSAPLVITTPMTGWFRCAGERGTGIAIALWLAAELGRRRPVLFVGTTGHEIGYLGVDRLVGEGGFGMPCAIVHVGASTAAGEVDAGVGTLSPNRAVLSSLPEEQARALAGAAENGGLRVLHQPPDWFGEGEMLKRLDRPLVSFVGSFSRFHTPHDTLERVTTPAMLAAAAATVAQTVDVFLAAVDPA